MILYLHGFGSSPQSHKARQLHAHLAARGLGQLFRCPQLPVSPRGAIEVAEREMAESRMPITLVGSSLGGCYATWLAEAHGCRAVLVNPAVAPHLSAEPLLGAHFNFHTGERFEFTGEHVAELAAIDLARITRPERYWLMVETGDEVLDYRLAVAKFAGARQTVIQGGEHGFAHWSEYLDEIVRFAAAP
ncbi:MAG: alpha/beta fold hydrolase [Rhodocyclaceae bacterium]